MKRTERSGRKYRRPIGHQNQCFSGLNKLPLAEQELEFTIFAKTGAGVKLFGTGVESKNLDSNHL